ncbi:VOC family protein [Streptomyces millisiae]|uniref:VOC family protein n=1 Tax=Streptomyces millisiae TaxID=3075542 RepID=A0ABU2LMQ2_9ACTN|nr:VOC family protein [Streptomyces sp. DSM 44918]MDT0318866.1 VOC family protein [Streptomyces sp. DSM 44918]
MITTDYVTGSPCWLDLGAPDVAAAATFYGAVFDWQFESFGPDAGGYGVFRHEGRSVAAAGRLTEEGARSAWMIYFRVHDADTAVRAVEDAGGAVRTPPVAAGDAGRMAQFTDPQGAQFAVWEPGANQGLEKVDDPGALMWTELYTTDAAAAKEFYGRLFGWETQDMTLPGGGGSYGLISPQGGGQGRMQGGVMQVSTDLLTLTDGRPYWHPVFHVTDCDAALGRVTGHGGRVQMGPEDAEGVGRLAVCVDPAGADFVVLTPSG